MATIPDVEFPKGGFEIEPGWMLCDTTNVRYVDELSPEEEEEVKAWIRANAADYEDSFDMSVECSDALGIFDLEQVLADRRQDRAIPHAIGYLCEYYFAGQWE